MLINRAYMTRQVHELESQNNGVVGHITSLMPIWPENKADEGRVVRKFEQGVDEVHLDLTDEASSVCQMKLARSF